MSNRNILIIVAIIMSGCMSYLREIPSFPESKILKFAMPIHGRINEELTWTVYANTCTDSVRVTTYDNRDLLRNYPLLMQVGEFEHGLNPASGLYNDWIAVIPGRYVLEIRVWNKWTYDYGVHYIDIDRDDVYQSWD